MRDIDVTFGVDFHAVGPNPPRVDFVFGEEIQKSKVGAMAERAIGINIKFQDTIAHRLVDIERLLIGRDTDAVSVIKIVRDLDPILRTGSKVKNLSHERGWRIDEVSKKGGVGAAISGHHDVVDAAIELMALVIGVPSTQLLTVEVELQNGAVFIGPYRLTGHTEAQGQIDSFV